MNPLDVLLLEVASHGYHCRVYLCYCLLFTEGSNVAPSISTCQCQINTTPSQVEALVPRFQEPPTADLLSELSSAHEVHV